MVDVERDDCHGRGERHQADGHPVVQGWGGSLEKPLVKIIERNFLGNNFLIHV